jgi:two-component system sensor histidine kinase YesM
MDVRVGKDKSMTVEMAAITDQFNIMMDDINQLIGKVREASMRQRDAEITMLEAQINPHFLYNTLDTINWMAIDANQMEISKAIASLARIFRYSIDRSNRLVTVREEAEWLKQYLSLQQMRLKNAFQYELKVSDAALEKPIHKLLFQPFVENAIRHGFAGLMHEPRLSIAIGCAEDSLCVYIEDNGRGMEEEKLASIRTAISLKEDQPGHIGILNAVARLRMYYGDNVDISIESEPDQGTRIMIRIPFGVEGEKACESLS